MERLVTTCLVPYNFPPDDKQKKLYELYVSLDENARKAFGEMFRSGAGIDLGGGI